jgi:uncharacterized HAD superfamily protein
MLGLDLDGVIYEIAAPICHVASEMTGRQVVKDDITKYGLTECLGLTEVEVKDLIFKCQEDHWLRSELIIPGTRRFLNEFGQNYPVVVITARPDAVATKEFLCQELTVEPEQILVFSARSREKGKLASKLGLTHFVDDHFVSLTAMMQVGIKPILFDQPWNQLLPAPQSRTWQLVDRIKNLNELWRFIDV